MTISVNPKPENEKSHRTKFTYLKNLTSGHLTVVPTTCYDWVIRDFEKCSKNKFCFLIYTDLQMDNSREIEKTEAEKCSINDLFEFFKIVI